MVARIWGTLTMVDGVGVKLYGFDISKEGEDELRKVEKTKVYLITNANDGVHKGGLPLMEVWEE